MVGTSNLRLWARKLSPISARGGGRERNLSSISRASLASHQRRQPQEQELGAGSDVHGSVQAFDLDVVDENEVESVAERGERSLDGLGGIDALRQIVAAQVDAAGLGGAADLVRSENANERSFSLPFAEELHLEVHQSLDQVAQEGAVEGLVDFPGCQRSASADDFGLNDHG